MTPSDAVAVDVRRLHPLTPFFDLVLLARQFALPLLLALFANRDRGQLLFVLPVAAGTAVGYAKWLRFTYAFDGRRLVISEGILTRRERVVPLDRIQQVDTESRLRHRLLGVTILKIETAGGAGAAEVDLSVVSRGEAERLRAMLSTAPAVERTAEPATEAEVQLLVRLGVPRLMLAGITGSELAVMLTILFWVGQLLDDLPEGFLLDRADSVTAPSGRLGYVAAGLFLLVMWFGLAASASVLKNGGYTLTRRGDDLHVSRGLLDRREASVPFHRVQSARVQESFVRRLLGMGSVRLRSTAGAVDVPLLTEAERAALFDAVLPGDRPEKLVPAPPAARRRAVIRRVAPSVVPVAAVAVLAPHLLLAALVLPLLGAVAGVLAFRGLAHGWGGGFVVAREGGLRRETFLVPSAKAQSTRLRSSPLQRRAGLATLAIDVAGGGPMPTIRDGDAARLRSLQSEVLSSAARQDEAAVRRQARERPLSPSPAGGSDPARRGSPPS